MTRRALWSLKVDTLIATGVTGTWETKFLSRVVRMI